MNEHFYSVIDNEIVTKSFVTAVLFRNESCILWLLKLCYFVLNLNPAVSTPANVLKGNIRVLQGRFADGLLPI